VGRRIWSIRRGGGGEKKQKRGIWINRRARRRKMKNSRRTRMGRKT
jgi:hypothetical protein